MSAWPSILLPLPSRPLLCSWRYLNLRGKFCVCRAWGQCWSTTDVRELRGPLAHRAPMSYFEHRGLLLSFFLSYLKIEFWDCLNKEFIILYPLPQACFLFSGSGVCFVMGTDHSFILRKADIKSDCVYHGQSHHGVLLSITMWGHDNEAAILDALLTSGDVWCFAIY